jgi:hypothetical protein
MASLPAYVYPAQRTVRRARNSEGTSRLRKPASAGRQNRFDWQTLLAEAYPVIGLVLIIAYVLWAIFAGEYALDWSGPSPATE